MKTIRFRLDHASKGHSCYWTDESDQVVDQGGEYVRSDEAHEAIIALTNEIDSLSEAKKEVAAEITLAAQSLGIDPDGLDDVSALRAIQAEGKRLVAVNAALLAVCQEEREDLASGRADSISRRVREHYQQRLARMDAAIALALEGPSTGDRSES